jgi:hypothetical protein
VVQKQHVVGAGLAQGRQQRVQLQRRGLGGGGGRRGGVERGAARLGMRHRPGVIGGVQAVGDGLQHDQVRAEGLLLRRGAGGDVGCSHCRWAGGGLPGRAVVAAVGAGAIGGRWRCYLGASGRIEILLGLRVERRCQRLQLIGRLLQDARPAGRVAYFGIHLHNNNSTMANINIEQSDFVS